MPSIDNVTEADTHPVKAITGVFHGFTVPMGESIAELIVQYVADTPSDGNVWRAMSLHLPSPRPEASNRILSSTSFRS